MSHLHRHRLLACLSAANTYRDDEMRCDAMPPSLVHHILFASCRRGPGFVGYWTGIHSWHGACQPYNATRICILPLPVSKVHPLFKLLPILGFRTWRTCGRPLHRSFVGGDPSRPAQLSAQLSSAAVCMDFQTVTTTATTQRLQIAATSSPRRLLLAPYIQTQLATTKPSRRTYVRYAQRETDSNRTRT
jgi:hypothetical protein